jgi:UDP-glucuronate decarboxylase
VVSNFILEALTGADITVYGDGTQTRSFCYVDDMVDGLVAMMRCPGVTGPVNLGNPEEYTMVELAEKIIGLTGSSSDIVHLGLPEDDPTCRRPDISLAKERLGWMPHTSVTEGLARTIDYFRAFV